MKKKKSTQDSWKLRIVRDRYEYDYQIYDKKGELIAEWESPPCRLKTLSREDAKLMAASKDLLLAVNKLLDSIPDYAMNDATIEAVTIALAALKKAGQEYHDIALIDSIIGDAK